MLDVDMMLLLYLDMLLLNQDAICNMKTNEFTRENESMKKTLTKPNHCYYSVKYSFRFRVTTSRITILLLRSWFRRWPPIPTWPKLSSLRFFKKKCFKKRRPTICTVCCISYPNVRVTQKLCNVQPNRNYYQNKMPKWKINKINEIVFWCSINRVPVSYQSSMPKQKNSCHPSK